MANVIIAVAVFLAQAAGQRSQNAEDRKRKQTTVRYFIEAMAVGVITTQRETAESLDYAGLQAAVVTASTGAKLVDVAEALVERLIVVKGRKAASANPLIAVQL